MAPTWWYPVPTMNKTETLAYQWLQDQGYSVSDIIFRKTDSPDFITADGKGWEVKLVRAGRVFFSTTQVSRLLAHPDCVVAFWENGLFAGIAPFPELAVPGWWGHFELKVEDLGMTNRTLRLPDDLDEALRVEAARRDESVHEYIVRCLRVRSAVSGITRTAVPDGPTVIAEVTNQAGSTPPLDAEGVALNAQKGKATVAPVVPEIVKNPMRQKGGVLETGSKSTCTCGPGERAKGKHNKHCPAK